MPLYPAGVMPRTVIGSPTKNGGDPNGTNFIMAAVPLPLIDCTASVVPLIETVPWLDNTVVVGIKSIIGTSETWGLGTIKFTV